MQPQLLLYMSLLDSLQLGSRWGGAYLNGGHQEGAPGQLKEAVVHVVHRHYGPLCRLCTRCTSVSTRDSPTLCPICNSVHLELWTVALRVAITPFAETCHMTSSRMGYRNTVPLN